MYRRFSTQAQSFISHITIESDTAKGKKFFYVNYRVIPMRQDANINIKHTFHMLLVSKGFGWKNRKHVYGNDIKD